MTLRLTLFALAVALASSASAQDTATQDVTVEVEEVNEITVTGGNVTLTLSQATAGSGFTQATDNTSATYAVTTNGTGKKITAALSSAYTTGIELSVALVPPTGAAANGSSQVLSASAVDLVTGISGVSQSGLAITYTASATAGVAPNSSGETRTVTYTVTASE